MQILILDHAALVLMVAYDPSKVEVRVRITHAAHYQSVIQLIRNLAGGEINENTL